MNNSEHIIDDESIGMEKDESIVLKQLVYHVNLEVLACLLSFFEFELQNENYLRFSFLVYSFL